MELSEESCGHENACQLYSRAQVGRIQTCIIQPSKFPPQRCLDIKKISIIVKTSFAGTYKRARRCEEPHSPVPVHGSLTEKYAIQGLVRHCTWGSCHFARWYGLYISSNELVAEQHHYFVSIRECSHCLRRGRRSFHQHNLHLEEQGG